MVEDRIMGFGCCVILLKEGKVLIGKRHDDAEKADSVMHGEGTWTLPGGKVDFGESLEQAAFRESIEETGVKIDKDKLKLISITNDIVEDAHFVTIGFVSENFEGDPKVMEPDEITEWRWFSLDKLPKPMFFPAEKALKNFIDNEVYKH
ncbi:MAG: NUDIX domain-containing protein [Candidatus Woesearchaeota archaeon]